MNRRLAILGMVIGILLVGIAFIHSQPTHAQDGEAPQEFEPSVLRGSAVFAEYCAACHGPKGEAIATGPAFVSIHNYDIQTLRNVINNGHDSNPNDNLRMIGYGASANGPLTEAQVEDLVDYMITWNRANLTTPPLPEANIEIGEAEFEGVGDPEHGASIYAYSCLGCHGLEAKGRGLPNFPAFTIDENVTYVVTTGDGHGFVPAFSTENGGPLTPRDIEDLNAYLQTITPEEAEEPEGVSILVIIMGLGAVGLVGAIYMANMQISRQKPTNEA